MRCTVWFCALISSLVSFVSVAAEGAQPDVEALVRGNSAFAFALYHELSEAEGNAFFSPYSISTALAMTYAGARGKTEKEMAAALHFTLSQTDLHPAFSKVESQLRRVQQDGSVRLSVANSLWPQKGDPLLADYLSLINMHYGVQITALDYMRGSEAARRQINAWVEDKTGARIKDLIQLGVLDETTRLVLVNAIYFKGLWRSPFKTANTKDSAFNIAAGQTVQTPMMTEKVKCRYASLPACDLLELPYHFA